MFLVRAKDPSDDDEGVEGNFTEFTYETKNISVPRVFISGSGNQVYFVGQDNKFEMDYVCDEYSELECEDETDDCFEYLGREKCVACNRNYYQDGKICYPNGSSHGLPVIIIVAIVLISVAIVVVVVIAIFKAKKTRK